jgi:streptogramin lyase
MTDLPKYRVDDHWEKLPDMLAHKDVSGVATDSSDRVFLLTRFDQQVLVYDRDGNFLKVWGEGVFSTAHGITVGPDDRVYCVDAGDHSVRVFSPDGELLQTIGTPGEPSDTGYNPPRPPKVHAVEGVSYPGGPFNRCTNLAIGLDGDIFVADGYANCRVHRFSKDGTLLHSWGEIGTGPGEFHLPHGIMTSPDGRVFVCDRENDRIQIFTPEGEFLDMWTNVQRPCDMAMDADGRIFVAELWRPKGKHSFVHGEMTYDHPGRVTMLDGKGEVMSRWGGSSTHRNAPGNFIAPHGITVDRHGDVYVAEVTYSFALRPGWVPEDHAPHQLQKFTRLHGPACPHCS